MYYFVIKELPFNAPLFECVVNSTFIVQMYSFLLCCPFSLSLQVTSMTAPCTTTFSFLQGFKVSPCSSFLLYLSSMTSRRPKQESQGRGISPLNAQPGHNCLSSDTAQFPKTLSHRYKCCKSLVYGIQKKILSRLLCICHINMYFSL